MRSAKERRRAMSKIYTVQEVADMLKACPDTIKRLIKGRQIKAFKIGNNWRVSEDSLQKFIKEREDNE